MCVVRVLLALFLLRLLTVEDCSFDLIILIDPILKHHLDPPRIQGKNTHTHNPPISTTSCGVAGVFVHLFATGTRT